MEDKSVENVVNSFKELMYKIHDTLEKDVKPKFDEINLLKKNGSEDIKNIKDDNTVEMINNDYTNVSDGKKNCKNITKIEVISETKSSLENLHQNENIPQCDLIIPKEIEQKKNNGNNDPNEFNINHTQINSSFLNNETDQKEELTPKAYTAKIGSGEGSRNDLTLKPEDSNRKSLIDINFDDNYKIEFEKKKPKANNIIDLNMTSLSRKDNNKLLERFHNCDRISVIAKSKIKEKVNNLNSFTPTILPKSREIAKRRSKPQIFTSERIEQEIYNKEAKLNQMKKECFDDKLQKEIEISELNRLKMKLESTAKSNQSLSSQISRFYSNNQTANLKNKAQKNKNKTFEKKSKIEILAKDFDFKLVKIQKDTNRDEYNPKISKRSIEISKILNRSMSNTKKPVFEKLFELSEKYDENREKKRNEQLPSFTPKINKLKYSNHTYSPKKISKNKINVQIAKPEIPEFNSIINIITKKIKKLPLFNELKETEKNYDNLSYENIGKYKLAKSIQGGCQSDSYINQTNNIKNNPDLFQNHLISISSYQKNEDKNYSKFLSKNNSINYQN